ncbi:hypothetical protein [Pseudonocardia hierapolitana]|uniref:hypothetical protein n=1 Tax=Pseudonocardia hierapolitana TaxID=1128676 RepID=UPI00147947C2|nr:hypothetical protein [Pseudonocardia hierapolitana]
MAERDRSARPSAFPQPVPGQAVEQFVERPRWDLSEQLRLRDRDLGFHHHARQNAVELGRQLAIDRAPTPTT